MKSEENEYNKSAMVFFLFMAELQCNIDNLSLSHSLSLSLTHSLSLPLCSRKQLNFQVSIDQRNWQESRRRRRGRRKWIFGRRKEEGERWLLKDESEHERRPNPKREPSESTTAPSLFLFDWSVPSLFLSIDLLILSFSSTDLLLTHAHFYLTYNSEDSQLETSCKKSYFTSSLLSMSLLSMSLCHHYAQLWQAKLGRTKIY